MDLWDKKTDESEKVSKISRVFVLLFPLSATSVFLRLFPPCGDLGEGGRLLWKRIATCDGIFFKSAAAPRSARTRERNKGFIVLPCPGHGREKTRTLKTKTKNSSFSLPFFESRIHTALNLSLFSSLSLVVHKFVGKQNITAKKGERKKEKKRWAHTTRHQPLLTLLRHHHHFSLTLFGKIFSSLLSLPLPLYSSKKKKNRGKKDVPRSLFY